MELMDIHTADESKPAQEAGAAHLANDVEPSNETTSSSKPQTLQGIQLVFLLSCLFLGNFTIGFVGIDCMRQINK